MLILRGVRDAAGALEDAAIEFANDTWRAYFAPGASSVEGTSLRRAAPGLAADRWPLVAAAIEGGSQLAWVFPAWGAPGVWGEVHTTPLGGDRLLVVVREVAGPDERLEAHRRGEAGLRAALDQSADTIALLRPLFGADGRFEDVEALYLNRSALDRWFGGVPLESLAGRRLFEGQPADRAALFDIYRRVLETGEPFEGQLQADSPTGQLWARVQVARTTEGLVHTSQDVTDAVIAREVLERSVRDLEEAQRVARVGSFEFDLATDAFSCSDEYLRLLGFDPARGVPSKEERLARSDPAESAQLNLEIGALARAGGGSYERLMRVLLPDGDVRHVLFRGRVAVSPDGGASVSGTAADVTEVRQAQDEALASGERFAAVVDAVEEAIAIVRPLRREDGVIADMEVEWANPAWLRREGIVQQDAAGVRGFALHPEFRALAPAIEAVLATGAPRSAEVRLGDGRWVAASISRIRDRILIASLDVTARRAEQEAAHDRLRAALDRAGDAVSVADADGRLVYVNAAYEAMFGTGRTEVLGRVPLIPSADASDEQLAAMDAQLRRGEAWSGTIERVRPDGRDVVGEASISPVADDQGALTGFVTVTRDVTERRAESARREQAARLEALGRLAGGVAHDFNNLLGAISGYARFLADGAPEGSQARADANQVLAAADRASALTRQLLAFSRRQPASPPSLVDPSAAVEALAPMLRRVIGEHVEIEVSVASGALWVLIDPGQLDQVVVNLAVNAGDAMPSGGRLSISVRPAERDGLRFARITVSDTGSGIDEAARAHLFEPFFTTKEPGHGTGLGLATVHGIVTACGGFVEVESSPGSGSTFTVDLPAHDPRTDPGSPPADGPLAGSGERVLVVEDDDAVRGVTVRVLHSLGYAVVAAASPEAALELGRGDPPVDLLLTDVRMPGIQGPELARMLRDRRPGLRVLFISGLVDELGPDDRRGAEVLAKPFNTAALAAAIRRALE